jgi:hypothetical protein
VIYTRIRFNNKKRNVRELRQPRQKSVDEKTVWRWINFIRRSPATSIFTVAEIREKILEKHLKLSRFEAVLKPLEEKSLKARIKYQTDRIKSSPANCLFTVADVREHVEELKPILQKGEESNLVIMSYDAQLRTLEKKVVGARVKRYVDYIKKHPKTSSFELRQVKEYLQRAERIGLDLSIYENQLPALERMVRSAKSKEKS